ncbi:MAG: hypothetical protein IT447_16320 [Phycisphaerales bacterium]|jgi:hypothetical protein|nr:hypothetical protein [Phycisphaerales bacterium]
MYKLMQKNQKKLMAFLGVGLMIVFILPSTFTGGGPGDPVVGYIGDETIRARESQEGRMELDLLSRCYTYLRQDQPMPLLARLSPTAPQEFRDHPEMFFLMLREARKMGVQVSKDQLGNTLQNQVISLDRLEPNDPRLVRAVNDFLMIENAFERIAATIKISHPLQSYTLAEQYQSIKVQLVEYDAKEFADKIAAPTTQQVDEQFAKYADLPAGRVDAKTDPFGFGYRYPDRVKLQYIAIPAVSVRQAVDLSRDEYTWKKDAYKYYVEHQGEFATTQPATQPTTNPLTLGAGAAPVTPTTGPTTRPFDEVFGEIRTKLSAQEADKLQKRIADRIAGTLGSDWLNYNKSQSANESAQSSLGVPYPTFEYLQQLAAQIQKEFNVLPQITQNADDYLTQTQLAALAGIGTATDGKANAVTYAFQKAVPFAPQSQQKSSDLLQLLQPSPILHDASGDAYLFRLTAAQPSHRPGDKSEVKDQIIADLHQMEGYQLAKKSAEQLLQSANQSASLQSAATASGRNVIQTGEFRNRAMEPIENYPISGPSKAAFLDQVFKLLIDAARGADHPRRLIELPQSGKVLVAQLDSVKADWPEQSVFFVELSVEGQLRAELRQNLQVQWFDWKSLVTRLNYKPAQPTEEPTPQRPAQPLL